MGSRVEVLDTVGLADDSDNDWELHFEKCIYHVEDEEPMDGFRFIWYHEGRKCGHRGQARIPNETWMLKLMAKAAQCGWYKPFGVTFDFDLLMGMDI